MAVGQSSSIYFQFIYTSNNNAVLQEQENNTIHTQDT